MLLMLGLCCLKVAPSRSKLAQDCILLAQVGSETPNMASQDASSWLQDALHGLHKPPQTSNMASKGLPSGAKMVSKSTFFGFIVSND